MRLFLGDIEFGSKYLMHHALKNGNDLIYIANAFELHFGEIMVYKFFDLFE